MKNLRDIDPDMASYPDFEDGKPPLITLKQYDVAPWAGTTCVDRQNGKYVVVVMQEPTKTVARIADSDSETLDTIFRLAHATHAKQSS